jgi:hypothetical protein
VVKVYNRQTIQVGSFGSWTLSKFSAVSHCWGPIHLFWEAAKAGCRVLQECWAPNQLEVLSVRPREWSPRKRQGLVAQKENKLSGGMGSSMVCWVFPLPCRSV